MAKVVVLGLAGEDGLWVADLEAGTVVPMKEDGSGQAQTAIAMRKSGASVNKGVDFAVSIASSGETASGLFETAGGLFES